MNWEKEFITDYQRLSLDSFTSKYLGKIPKEITTQSVVDYLKNTHQFQILLDSNWLGDSRDLSTYYLLALDDGKFEVFLSERGGKHWLRTCDTLEQAVSYKLELIFNSLMAE